MSKTLTTYFLTDLGTPATGLSPTIRIRDLSDNSLVITDAATVEVGDGGYKYTFVAYDPAKNYQIRWDAGSTITARYSYGWNYADYSVEIQQLVDIETGKWQIIGDQMIFSKSDNTTEIMRFNLFDIAGNATMTDVYRREKV